MVNDRDYGTRLNCGRERDLGIASFASFVSIVVFVVAVIHWTKVHCVNIILC